MMNRNMIDEKRFICPITQEVMGDPVKASDGQTYEREAIERWILKSHPPYKSPVKNEKSLNLVLTPDDNMRSNISEYFPKKFKEKEIESRQWKKERLKYFHPLNTSDHQITKCFYK
jgi:hypothetical protein